MDSSFRFHVVTAFVAVLFVFLVWKWWTSPQCNVPGPKGYPVIGIGLDLPPRATEVFRKWALEYGELFKIRVGWYDWVVINSPEAFKQILDKQVCIHVPTPLQEAKESCF